MGKEDVKKILGVFLIVNNWPFIVGNIHFTYDRKQYCDYHVSWFTARKKTYY